MTVIFIIIIIIIIYLLLRNNNKEHFADDITQQINNIYKADIEAIRNLSNYATYLMNGSTATGNITVPGIVRATNTLCVNNTCLNSCDDNEKIRNPTTQTKISGKGIQFGCDNANRQIDSAQISAGLHEANSLNIMGMSNQQGDFNTRKIKSWAEGGFNVIGNVISDRGICVDNSCLTKDDINKLKDITTNGKISLGGNDGWDISVGGGNLKFQRKDYPWTGYSGGEFNNRFGKEDMRNKGVMLIGQDGNIWSDKFPGQGWISDNINSKPSYDVPLRIRLNAGPRGQRNLSTENGSSNEIGATWRDAWGDWEKMFLVRA